MTDIIRGRWQDGTARYYKIYVECPTIEATLQSQRVRRGFLNPRPTFRRRAWEVEARDWQHDETVFAASFFDVRDAKAAIRAHVA